jgi:hypothetical protein
MWSSVTQLAAGVGATTYKTRQLTSLEPASVNNRWQLVGRHQAFLFMLGITVRHVLHVLPWVGVLQIHILIYQDKNPG